MQRRSQSGFSLVETLVGILVMALSVVGSFEALRLADLKARHARLDSRISEVLRENSDYILYVAYDLLPQDGGILSQGSLYQLYDSTHKIMAEFLQLHDYRPSPDLNPGTVSETKNITLNLTYQVDGDSPTSPLKSQTIVSDAISRRKS